LEAGGIRTTAGVLAQESTALNGAWTFSIVHGRPKVTWKFAATLDGRSAAADGSSRWITGPLARADVHELRSHCDAILVAAGRTPNIEDLDLEAAGVAFTKTGVTVNEYLQTSQPHIYAAGDVAGPYLFTHVADSHARTVVRNILLPWWKGKREDTVVPWCTYTSPEVARVGLNEREAEQKGIACDVWKEPLEDVDRAVVESEEEGFAKVLTEKGGDRILGATLVAERAGDLLHEFVLAMKAGVGLKEISRTIHAYPTYAEIARKVADKQQKSRLTPLTKRVFSALYRLARRS